MENGNKKTVCVMFILCFHLTNSDWLNCGSEIPACLCKWSSGKKTASCNSGDLGNVPHLSPDIQVLDLNGNPLKVLEKDAFASVGLLNLQRLNLSATNLHHLQADTFCELRILIELDLSRNELVQLSPDTFRGNDRLRLLVLNDNPLKILAEHQFPPLQHLKRLEISRCRLEYVHRLAFADLKALEIIYLHQNMLTYLHHDTFNLPMLKTLTLAGNPWNCNCRLKKFHTWFLKSNLGNEEVFCKEPRENTKRTWQNIRGSDMFCRPEVFTNPSVIRTEAGADISFSCIAKGVPIPNISWWFNEIEITNETSDNITSVVNLFQRKSINEYDEDVLNKSIQWLNVSVSNVSSELSGKWTCKAKSSVGEAKSYLTLVLPKARIATARSAPDYSAFFVVAISIAAMTASGFVAACFCWKTKRRRMTPTRSFTEQEKKLLDTSLAVSLDRSSGDLGSSYNFEMLRRSESLFSEDVERKKPIQITIEGPPCSFMPPPPEFSVPAPYTNIFISVRVLDEDNKGPDVIRGSATLPRRSRTCVLKPNYDNMGPRVTAAGSSVWSLPDSNEVAAVENSENNNPLLLLSTYSTEFTAL